MESTEHYCSLEVGDVVEIVNTRGILRKWSLDTFRSVPLTVGDKGIVSSIGDMFFHVVYLDRSWSTLNLASTGMSHAIWKKIS